MKKYITMVIALVLLMVSTSAVWNCSQALASSYFSLRQNDNCYIQWKDVKGGRNIHVQLENTGSETVDAYTIEVRGKDIYGDDMLLRANNGDYCDSLWYTLEQRFKPGRYAYSKWFFVEGGQAVKSIYIKVVKYHTASGTVEIPAANQVEYNWDLD